MWDRRQMLENLTERLNDGSILLLVAAAFAVIAAA
jgi:hypothetical protein